MTSSSAIDPHAYVGFDTITEQLIRRKKQIGFELNLMVVGRSGLGKSTFVNTLFAANVAQSSARRSAHENVVRTPEIFAQTKVLEENEVRLKLTVIDTPGFGDQVNNDKCWEPIVRYIKDQHSMFLRKELTAQRERHPSDQRVHCVLYFLAPSGHGLSELDATAIKRIADVANVIPVIAKSDMMTLEERDAFKQRVCEELAALQVKLYPYIDNERTPEDARYVEMIRETLPFAIVGSEQMREVAGRMQPVRDTPAGTVLIEDPKHCEYKLLKSFVMTTHLQELIDTTSEVHYESFRMRQLKALKENSAPKKR